jgi:hypothetical protein
MNPYSQDFNFHNDVVIPVMLLVALLIGLHIAS